MHLGVDIDLVSVLNKFSVDRVCTIFPDFYAITVDEPCHLLS